VSLFDDATNAVSTPIVPQDRFIIECLKLEEAPPYAPPGEQPKADARPGIRWVLALYSATTGARFTFQDEPYEFFQTTTSNMQRGARAREYAEAFLGRDLSEGERLDPSMLIGKKCVGMVSHEFTRDRSKKNAKLVGVEPYREAVAARPAARSAGATAVMERPSAASVSADASDADIDTALLISSVEKKIKQAEKLQTSRHLDWLAMDLTKMDADELDAIKAAIQQDIDAD
jgi:hypothetical protein